MPTRLSLHHDEWYELYYIDGKKRTKDRTLWWSPKAAERAGVFEIEQTGKAGNYEVIEKATGKVVAKGHVPAKKEE